MDNNHNDKKPLYSDINKFLADVDEALSLLRSAGEIAARNGADTNWTAFHSGIADILSRFNLKPISARTYRLPKIKSHDPSKN